MPAACTSFRTGTSSNRISISSGEDGGEVCPMVMVDADDGLDSDRVSTAKLRGGSNAVMLIRLLLVKAGSGHRSA